MSTYRKVGGGWLIGNGMESTLPADELVQLHHEWMSQNGLYLGLIIYDGHFAYPAPFYDDIYDREIRDRLRAFVTFFNQRSKTGAKIVERAIDLQEGVAVVFGLREQHHPEGKLHSLKGEVDTLMQKALHVCFKGHDPRVLQGTRTYHIECRISSARAVDGEVQYVDVPALRIGFTRADWTGEIRRFRRSLGLAVVDTFGTAFRQPRLMVEHAGSEMELWRREEDCVLQTTPADSDLDGPIH